jgi:hypothetical protein
MSNVTLWDYPEIVRQLPRPYCAELGGDRL